MPGSREENSVDRDTLLFEFDHFTIHPGTCYIKEMDSMEDVYAVVYKTDSVVQMYSPTIAGAIQNAANGDSMIQFMAALAESKEMEASTEGLLGDALNLSGKPATPDDTIN